MHSCILQTLNIVWRVVATSIASKTSHHSSNSKTSNRSCLQFIAVVVTGKEEVKNLMVEVVVVVVEVVVVVVAVVAVVEVEVVVVVVAVVVVVVVVVVAVVVVVVIVVIVILAVAVVEVSS
jgi:hypothetical protein